MAFAQRYFFTLKRDLLAGSHLPVNVFGTNLLFAHVVIHLPHSSLSSVIVIKTNKQTNKNSCKQISDFFHYYTHRKIQSRPKLSLSLFALHLKRGKKSGNEVVENIMVSQSEISVITFDFLSGERVFLGIFGQFLLKML